MEEKSIYSRFLEALCFWSLLLALSVTAMTNTWAVVPFAVWFLLKVAFEVKSSWQEKELK